ncbi:MAG: glycosyltransferase family protein [Hahellaceae bacterium]|nr:glycosyltransferase family protein [Hahellaceae bacterium]
MNVLAVLQARMSSSRLPGKVLKPILNKPMLAYQIERIARCRLVDKLIVATSTEPADAPIADLCHALNITCYRGSLDDVLDRFYQAASLVNPQHVLRLTGDCPLVSPTIIDRLIQLHLSLGADYTSNCYPPSLPDGLDAEVVRWDLLKAAWKEAPGGLHREHVTSFIRDEMPNVDKASYQHPHNYASLRLTVDYPEDFDLVAKIFEALYPDKPDFELDDIIRLLAAHPDWILINQNFERNSEYLNALAQLKLTDA